MSGGTPAAESVRLNRLEYITALVFGVLYPADANASSAFAMVSSLPSLFPGRRVRQAEVSEAIRQLEAQGLLQRHTRTSGAHAVPALAPRLTLHAHTDGVLQPILEVVTDHLVGGLPPAARRHHPLLPQIQLRALVIAGRFDRLPPIIEPAEWRFLASPGVEHLLATLPAPHRDVAARTCAHVALRRLDLAPELLAALEALAAGSAVVATDVAFIDLLRGDFAAAQQRFTALPVAERATRAAVTGEFATHAAIALLRGDIDLAAQRVERALEAERRGTRVRNAYVPVHAFALATLALARQDTAEARAQIQRLGRAIGRNRPLGALCDLMPTARSIRDGGFDGGADHELGDAFAGVVAALQLRWTDTFERFLATEYADELDTLRERAAHQGLRWLEAECCVLLDGLWSGLDGPDAEGLAAVRARAAELHALIGSVSLADLITPLPAWEAPLQHLERLAAERAGPATRARPAAAGGKRLAWLVLDDAGAGLVATPVEQSLGRTGTWSMGRPVALKRLVTKGADIPYLQEQDRAAAALARVERHYSGWAPTTDYVADDAAIHALAGHPYVFDRDGAHIEVVQREPALTIDETADGQLRIAIEPYGADASHVARRVGPTRIEATRFTASHKRLFEIIPAQGLVLPAQTRERALGAITALAGDVRVESRLDELADAGTTSVDGDPLPAALLLPLGAGFSLALVVEPIPGSGIQLSPGEGGALVFHRDADRTVRARRDLDAERREAQRVLDACPALDPTVPVAESRQFPDPGGALDVLDQLHTAGVRLLWPQGERLRIAARAGTAQLQVTLKSAREWFAASGELRVDEDTVLEFGRLFELLEAAPRSRFLALGEGQYVALSDSLRRQLDELRGLSLPGAKGTRRIHALAAHALDGLFDDDQVRADGEFRARIERLQSARAFTPPVPSTLQAELRPYQVDGYRWLAQCGHWGVGACLADDMGLGKTVQTLAVLLQRAPEGPALVVAPTSVASNWLAEARRFAPTLNVLAYEGAPDARGALLEGLGPFDVRIVTYGLLVNDIDRLEVVHWNTVVLDEAQAIKNSQSQRARAAMALSADFRIATTGTPVQNHLMELHALFEFLNPGLLGPAAQFAREYVAPLERSADAAGQPDGLPAAGERDVHARTRLRRLIAPFVLRRLKYEVLDDLPARTEIRLDVELSAEEAALYEVLRRRAVAELQAASESGVGAGERQLQVLAHLTRLRQLCCNPALVQDVGAPPSSKLAAFDEVLEELLANRHKVLVFSQFVGHLKLIERHLQGKGVRYQYLDGQTPARTRTERVAAFQAGDGDVFLISLKAGGVGLNLTAADYVIHMDPWWNPAVEDQASDRAHRIGQTRPVTIYRLVAKGTIEAQILDLHDRKRDLADRLLEGTDTAVRLDAEELLELLRAPM